MENIMYVKTKKEIKALGSALTLEGLKLEDVGKFLDWIENRGAKFINRRAYVITGEIMNKKFKLTGSNAYPDDLTIVSVDLNDIKDCGKLVFARFEIGARWLDDIIDNNVRREMA